MKNEIEQTLIQLQKEFEENQHTLIMLDRNRNELQERLLKMAGAIQILNELQRKEKKEKEKDIKNGK
jgi:diphthamide biosynthesis methyltransferase